MSKRNITTTLIAVVSVMTATAQTGDREATPLQRPRLVVSVVIDKLTTSRIERYTRLYGDEGFARLFAEGTVYDNVSYPFDDVDRISATSAIVTGTTPYYNGIIGEQWLDRATLRPTNSIGDTPESLLVSTVTDELKVATNGLGIVYSVAGDKETAIVAGGHAANAALWIDGGGWRTVGYYPTDKARWVSAYNKVTSTSSQSTDLHDKITDMAVQCVASGGMGTDDVSDMLMVNYDVADTEESYLSLDRNIGSLMRRIEDAVGKERVLFVITSTGRKEEEPADYEKYRIPTGTFYINRTVNLLNMFLSATYGQGRYAEACFRNQIFLNKKLIEQRKISQSEILALSKNFIMELSGVRNVFTIEEIMANRCPDERVRNGYNPSVCGDLIIEIAPGWTLLNEETGRSHQQLSDYVPFPVIFIGSGAAPQLISTHITVDRIAPTIAKTINIRAPNACRANPIK